MQVSPVSDIIKVEVDLTPTEAGDLYKEVNSISGMTSLTVEELNTSYPVTSQLLNSLNGLVNGATVPQP